MARLKTPIDAAGAFYLHEQVEEDYARQLTSEVRLIENGKPVWKQRAKDNHFLDVEAMLAAIGYTMNVQRIPEGVVRPLADAVLPDDEGGGPPEGDPPPPPPPPAMAGSGGGSRSRFAKIGARLNR